MKRTVVRAALLTLALLASTVVIAVVWRNPTANHVHEFATQTTERVPPPLDRIELSSSKIAAGGLQLATVARRKLQPLRRVPGRIRYDESNHVAVRTPVAGVLLEVLVNPGDRVSRGQTLARLSSQEIGEARADLLLREQNLHVAQVLKERAEQIDANLQALLPCLESRAQLETVESQFSGKLLGEYREKLLSAYSQFLLADDLFNQGQSVAPNALAGAVQRERRSKREVAHAVYKSALETCLFGSRRASSEAANAAADARRQRDISRQHLQTLSGTTTSWTENASSPGDLSLLEIGSPICGTVEQRRFTRTERVAASDELFVVANPETLWVAAAVRENEWSALELSPGAELVVEPSGAPQGRYSARVVYIGREVASDSQSVSLMASLSNANGRLRPGMYANVDLPLGPPVEAIAVAPPCIVQHDGEKFVFVSVGPQSFRRVLVETGVATEDWIEVRKGLTVGMRVVQKGAFLLLSEMLLEREE